jgi:predicted RNase H-like nuclease (RuvC/YqgF family)
MNRKGVIFILIIIIVICVVFLIINPFNKGSVDDYQITIAEMQRTINKLTEGESGLAGLLADRDEKISVLTNENNILRDENTALQQRIGGGDSAITSLETERANLNRTISQQQTAIAEKDRTISSLRSEIEQQDQQITDLNNRLARIQNLIGN